MLEIDEGGAWQQRRRRLQLKEGTKSSSRGCIFLSFLAPSLSRMRSDLA